MCSLPTLFVMFVFIALRLSYGLSPQVFNLWGTEQLLQQYRRSHSFFWTQFGRYVFLHQHINTSRYAVQGRFVCSRPPAPAPLPRATGAGARGTKWAPLLTLTHAPMWSERGRSVGPTLTRMSGSHRPSPPGHTHNNTTIILPPPRPPSPLLLNNGQEQQRQCQQHETATP